MPDLDALEISIRAANRAPAAREGSARTRSTRKSNSEPRAWQAFTRKRAIHPNPPKHSSDRKQAVTRQRPIQPPCPPMPLRNDVSHACGDSY